MTRPATRAAAAAAACSLIAFAFTAGFDIVHSSGEVGGTEKNGSGCVCHGFVPSPAVSVRITGPASVAAGSTAAFEIVMTGGPAVAGGFNVAAAHGALAAADSTAQVLDPGGGQSPELTHTAPKPFTADTVRWAFRYTAPAAPGPDTLFSAGNSVDLDGVPTGDAWNFGAPSVVTVVPDTSVGVAEEPRPARALLVSAYPNPFNPRTQIAYTLDRPGGIRLEIFGMDGSHVATLADGPAAPGTHEVGWDASGSPSGVYLARLLTHGGSVTQKLLLVR